jgi:hypothetical protein
VLGAAFQPRRRRRRRRMRLGQRLRKVLRRRPQLQAPAPAPALPGPPRLSLPPPPPPSAGLLFGDALGGGPLQKQRGQAARSRSLLGDGHPCAGASAARRPAGLQERQGGGGGGPRGCRWVGRVLLGRWRVVGGGRCERVCGRAGRGAGLVAGLGPGRGLCLGASGRLGGRGRGAAAHALLGPQPEPAFACLCAPQTSPGRGRRSPGGCPCAGALQCCATSGARTCAGALGCKGLGLRPALQLQLPPAPAASGVPGARAQGAGGQGRQPAGQPARGLSAADQGPCCCGDRRRMGVPPIMWILRLLGLYYFLTRVLKLW